MNKLIISALAVTAQLVNAAPRINRQVNSYYPDGTKPWSTFRYNDGFNGQLFLEVRSQVECDQTMDNIKSFFADTSNGVTILPANKPEILSCRPNPHINEFGILHLLSLPSRQCTCVPEPGVNTVTLSLNRMCARVTGTPESDWTGINEVFKCQSNSDEIHIWKFDTAEDAGRASHCLNKLQEQQKWKAVHYPVEGDDDEEDEYVCYVKTEDPQICAETAAELSTDLGQNMVCSNDKAIGPDGSCYESGSDGSSITSALEQKCKDILDIAPTNVKYSWITFTDAAICEASKAWRFQSRTKCNIFASCLNEVHAESLRSESPTPSPTPSPTLSPTSTPTASPINPPPPTPKPTHIQDTISYCKSKKDSRSDCANANADYGSTICGWHTKKSRCVPWKVRNSIEIP